MKIIPLAAESLGTRSMATYVETKDCRIVIDPGTRLAPKRFGLPPHKVEKERKRDHWRLIKEYVKRSKVIIVSHYHYDHYNPDAPSVFRGKLALLKDPDRGMNENQKRRGRGLKRSIERYVSDWSIADDQTIEFGNTSLCFSKPHPHGPSGFLGSVIQTSIHEGKESFLHTSDIQGPFEERQLQFILLADPHTMICDGPPTYLPGVYSEKMMEAMIKNMQRVISETGVKHIVLDHYLLRLNWREKVSPLLLSAEEAGVRVETAAEYAGKSVDLLEARRKELYQG